MKVREFPCPKCQKCGESFTAGDAIAMTDDGHFVHASCGTPEEEPSLPFPLEKCPDCGEEMEYLNAGYWQCHTCEKLYSPMLLGVMREGRCGHWH